MSLLSASSVGVGEKPGHALVKNMLDCKFVILVFRLIISESLELRMAVRTSLGIKGSCSK